MKRIILGIIIGVLPFIIVLCANIVTVKADETILTDNTFECAYDGYVIVTYPGNSASYKYQVCVDFTVGTVGNQTRVDATKSAYYSSVDACISALINGTIPTNSQIIDANEIGQSNGFNVVYSTVDFYKGGQLVFRKTPLVAELTVGKMTVVQILTAIQTPTIQVLTFSILFVVSLLGLKKGLVLLRQVLMRA